jgi:polysaccharide biosynthesis protein PslH
MIKEKILFIYNNALDGSYGGSQGTKKAYDGLSHYFIITKYSCEKRRNKLRTFLLNCLLFSGNLSLFDCNQIMKVIDTTTFNAIYFDVSLHGRLVKKIKKRYPNLKIIVNYHNEEKKYFHDMLIKKGFLFLPVYLAACFNEQLSSRYGDYHIFITKEDKKNIHFHGKSCIIPVTLEDYFKEMQIVPEKSPYLLFIGAACYANIQGVQFIIDKIAPYINLNFVIAGKGMKTAFMNARIPTNIEIRDFIPDLSELYTEAAAVISPLFTGSGAKVKVAEALMFGKKIIGTPLTFYGYDIHNTVKIVCETANDFITEINKLDTAKKFFAISRKLFLDNYSNIQNIRYYKSVETFVDNG